MIARVFGGLRRRPGASTAPPGTPAIATSADNALEANRSTIRSLRNAARFSDALVLARNCVSRFPRSSEALCLLGDSLLACGDAEQAVKAFTAALDLQPDHVESLVGQARSFRANHAIEDAVDSLEIALAHDPRALPALVELAAIWEETAAWQAAAPLIERALEIEPMRADLWVRLAAARDGCEQFDAAASACERALAIDGNCLAALVNLGMLHLERFGDPQRAEAHFREALARDPACHAARANLGLALQEQGRFDEALALYEAAITQAPEFIEFRWNRGLARLMRGEYERGWLDYEARFDRAGGRGRRAFPFAPWQGDTEIDGALLVYAEQGLGDEIMFASCLPDLEQRRMEVVLECSPRLQGLLRRSFPAIQVRGEARGNDRAWLGHYPRLSRQIPIGSLPLHLRTRREHFPRHLGYLQADPHAVTEWRDRLASLGGTMNVGLGWRAGTPKTRRSQKSTGLSALLPLLDVPGVRWVCLQHDLREDERALLERHGGTVWPEALGDLDQSAALLSALDLTITVASTSAHLAGALGRPVWILLGASPEWRWQSLGDTTPWYPTARLWRQEQPGDWNGIVLRIRQALTESIDEKRLPGLAAGRA